MWAIALQSVRFGLFAALACVLTSLCYRLALALLGERCGRQPPPRYLIETAEALGAVTALPGIVFQPAFLTLFAYGLLGHLPGSETLRKSAFGIVFLGALMHLPISHFALRSLPLDHFLKQFRLLESLGCPKLRAGLFALAVPISAECFQVLLFLSVMIQGIVFIPSLNMGTSKDTIGRALYDALAAGTLGPKITSGLTLIFLAEIFGVILLRWVMRACSGLLRKCSTSVLGPSGAFQNKRKMGRRLTAPVVLLLPTVLVAGFYAAFAGFCMYKFFAGVTQYGFPSILREVKSQTYDTPFSTACANTGLLAALTTAAVCTLIACAISVAGSKDRWTHGTVSRRLYETALLCCLLPPSLLAYVALNQTTLLQIRGTMFLLFVFLCSSWTLVATQREVFSRVFNAERLRRSLGAKCLSFWRLNFSIPVTVAGVLATWAFMLVWNDVTVQLFGSPGFQGLPNRMMAISLHSISDKSAVIFVGLQLGGLAIAVPALIALRRWKSL